MRTSAVAPSYWLAAPTAELRGLPPNIVPNSARRHTSFLQHRAARHDKIRHNPRQCRRHRDVAQRWQRSTHRHAARHSSRVTKPSWSLSNSAMNVSTAPSSVGSDGSRRTAHKSTQRRSRRQDIPGFRGLTGGADELTRRVAGGSVEQRYHFRLIHPSSLVRIEYVEVGVGKFEDGARQYLAFASTAMGHTPPQKQAVQATPSAAHANLCKSNEHIW